MNTKYRIGILGLGGVGGFIGAMLADYYKDNNDVEIIFIARGENLKAIKENGITLQRDNEVIKAKPSIASDKLKEIGKLNLLLCCVKGYSLDEAVSNVKECIDGNTIILPLLNGVDAPEKIKKIVPDSNTLEGCIYIVSKIIEPGIIKESGLQHRVFAGMNSDEFNTEGFSFLKNAGINISLKENIEKAVWEKFIFISPLATATSYFNSRVGKILENEEKRQTLLILLDEIKLIADARGLMYEDDIALKSFEKIKALPYHNTTSMHNDFKKGGKTELESLTGYIIKQAEKYNITLPVYKKLYEELKKK